jgi:toxin ParE1/3/4
MRLRIEISGDAEQDLIQHSRYIEKDDPEAAMKFLLAAQRTFEKLADYKFLGSRYDAKREDLKGLREWAVEGFPRHLIFFEIYPDRLSVVRVVHASQDWRKV